MTIEISKSGTGNSKIDNHILNEKTKGSPEARIVQFFSRILHKNDQTTAKIKELMSTKLVVLNKAIVGGGSWQKF